MNILELAKKTDCGLVIDGENICIEIGKDCLYAINYELAHFAQAVIADYKAGLVPVYGIVDSGTFVSIEETKTAAIRFCSDMNKHDDGVYSFEPLYALPSGETK